MGNIFDRLAQGPGAMQQGDYNDWNEMVGTAPPKKFGRVASNAIQQVPPQQYQRHIQPGVDGTDPLGSLNPGDRTDLAQSLISTLTGGGTSPQQIQSNAGVQNLDPRAMSPQDLANLLQYTHKNDPQALGKVATQFQDKPDILHALLGNKALLLLAAGLGAKYLADQSAKKKQQQSKPQGRV